MAFFLLNLVDLSALATMMIIIIKRCCQSLMMMYIIVVKWRFGD